MRAKSNVKEYWFCKYHELEVVYSYSVLESIIEVESICYEYSLCAWVAIFLILLWAFFADIVNNHVIGIVYNHIQELINSVWFVFCKIRLFLIQLNSKVWLIWNQFLKNRTENTQKKTVVVLIQVYFQNNLLNILLVAQYES